jgi:hypothetical protein
MKTVKGRTLARRRKVCTGGGAETSGSFYEVLACAVHLAGVG